MNINKEIIENNRCPKCNEYLIYYEDRDIYDGWCAKFCYCGFVQVRERFKHLSERIIKNVKYAIGATE